MAQLVILYGIESWVATGDMLKVLTAFHHQAAQRITGVETTGFHGAGHAVETMYAIIQAPSLPVKIYLDEIDKLGNYESIFT